MISLQYGHIDDCLVLSVLNTVYYTLYNHDNDECSEQSSLETVYIAPFTLIWLNSIMDKEMTVWWRRWLFRLNLLNKQHVTPFIMMGVQSSLLWKLLIARFTLIWLNSIMDGEMTVWWRRWLFRLNLVWKQHVTPFIMMGVQSSLLWKLSIALLLWYCWTPLWMKRWQLRKLRTSQMT